MLPDHSVHLFPNRTEVCRNKLGCYSEVTWSHPFHDSLNTEFMNISYNNELLHFSNNQFLKYNKFHTI